jgi:putative hydrolase of the HAD superfamily
MIKNIIFDLGGVVITLDPQQAADRFAQLGLKNAEEHLNSYTQQGIFGDLEAGDIDAETFRRKFSEMVGHNVTHQQCAFAWQGYAKEVPQRNLDALKRLRKEGYRLILLSNTNPYMMEWVDSPDFDGHGHSVTHYFDALYLSYRLHVMKPSDEIFMRMLMGERITPSECLFLDDGPRNVAAASQRGLLTYCPENGEDWTQTIYNYL